MWVASSAGASCNSRGCIFILNYELHHNSCVLPVHFAFPLGFSIVVVHRVHVVGVNMLGLLRRAREERGVRMVCYPQQGAKKRRLFTF
jgi:hypothetical protein